MEQFQIESLIILQKNTSPTVSAQKVVTSENWK